MNKNKLIFAIIGWIILVFILFVVSWLNKGTEKKNTNKWQWDFSIWMIWKNKDWLTSVVDDFKKINKKYSNTNIKVETFSSYSDYQLALTAWIIDNKAPDIFVLNNNEKHSIFENQAYWINPKVINPNDFRKKFKWVFADDLILTDWEWEKKVEYLKWIPVWYETLWVFYNRRYVKAADLWSLSSLNNVVADLKEKKPNLIPIWIWNWSTVLWSEDIITQFFMFEDGVSSLSDVTSTKMKQWLASYLQYWNINWDNGYNSRFAELSKFWQTSLDLFSKWETFMVVGYPSLIDEIYKKWFSKNFLEAAPFPHYFSWNWKTLVNYDYFVINKDTKNLDLSNAFMLYLSSDNWAENFLKWFKYYLPALLSLESDKLDEKISDNFNIVLKDFYNNDYELSSFDKWIKSTYDKEIISILDNASNYENEFLGFQKKILCNATKISSFENLSKSCE